MARDDTLVYSDDPGTLRDQLRRVLLKKLGDGTPLDKIVREAVRGLYEAAEVRAVVTLIAEVSGRPVGEVALMAGSLRHRSS